MPRGLGIALRGLLSTMSATVAYQGSIVVHRHGHFSAAPGSLTAFMSNSIHLTGI